MFVGEDVRGNTVKSCGLTRRHQPSGSTRQLKTVCDTLFELRRECSPARELVSEFGDFNCCVVPRQELIVVLKNINQHLSVSPRMMFAQESRTKHHLHANSFKVPVG